VGTRCADHVTPLYPKKLALTSPTGGGRSVGIVRSRTKATEFSLVCYCYCYSNNNTGNRFLLQRLVGFQVVKKFPAFCIIRRFITVCTKSLQIFRYLSQINSIHAISSYFFKIRFIIALSSTPVSSRRPLSFTLLQQNPICMYFLLPVWRGSCPAVWSHIVCYYQTYYK
jgi:hypothetical protein